MLNTAQAAAHLASAIPDFSAPAAARTARPTRSSVVLDAVASALRDLDAATAQHADSPTVLAQAVGLASLRLAKASQDLLATIEPTRGFAIVQGPMSQDILHDGRRIGHITPPTETCDRWTVCITLRLDETLPAPFRWYFTKFDSLDAIRAFLSAPIAA